MIGCRKGNPCGCPVASPPPRIASVQAKSRHKACPYGRYVLMLCLAALAAWPSPSIAVSEGITGNSGKQGANCADCHSGGTAPLVRLEGPREVYAGALATFRFVVQTQSIRQQFAGFNVAASDGQLEPVRGQGEHLDVGELTHDAPKPAIEDETTWLFTWRAPSTAGSEVIFGAGLSANGTETRSGDEMALLQVAVTVTDDPRPGDANCDGALSAADVVGIAHALPPETVDECGLTDADCNGAIQARDITVVIAALFDSPSATDCNVTRLP